MALGRYRKTPDERKRYSIDYYDWLDQNEKIFSMNFRVSPVETYGLEIDAYSIDPDGSRVVFFANGGIDDTVYIVNVQATSDGGQLKEDEVIFEVEAIDEDDETLVVYQYEGTYK